MKDKVWTVEERLKAAERVFDRAVRGKDTAHIRERWVKFVTSTPRDNSSVSAHDAIDLQCELNEARELLKKTNSDVTHAVHCAVQDWLSRNKED